MRSDIPPQMFRDLLLRATAVVQQRLLASAKPDARSEIRRVLARVSDEVSTRVITRDYSQAEREVETLRREGRLDEAKLLEFAKSGLYDKTIATLALLCAVPIEVVDRLVGGDRPDPVLILCRSVGWGWPTAKAVIMARPGGRNTSTQGLDTAYTNFERLSQATAQRVMRFWQARPQGAGMAR
jgi:uncharacterized protein (DUF2336 family)